MSNTVKTINLTLHLDTSSDSDPDELDRLTRHLLSEIQELEVESAELAKGETIPEGAKSADPVTLGALAVVILPVVAPKLIEFLQSWSLRGENRRVKIKAQTGDRVIEVDYSPSTMSASELKRLVNTLTEALPNKEEK